MSVVLDEIEFRFLGVKWLKWLKNKKQISLSALKFYLLGLIIL